MLTDGTEREVRVPGRSRLRTMVTYTIPEAAAALGKSLVNFRRWLDNELIPAPVLIESVRSHACYCTEELEVVAAELAAHERDFAYLCAQHEHRITRMAQLIHGFRDMEFGGNRHG